MQSIITIKRQENKDSPSYSQSFVYDGDRSDSIALVLTSLNDRESLTDADGENATPIAWECGCRQRKCGACAMLINGLPKLACSVLLGEVCSKGKAITVEPLSKFPVVKDLIVNRNVMFESLKNMHLWLTEEAYMSTYNHEAEYQSSRCLMCGCCLEICPNFKFGQVFAGAIASVNAYKVLEQNIDNRHQKKLAELYRKHYFEGCGKSLSCHNICPIGLPVEELMVRSNAVAVWK